ncbi:MAG: nucleotidyltransferase family protein [Muricauda sp.]|nr:nucleotidyltransferase family protein [Allomuricauda sp.]
MSNSLHILLLAAGASTRMGETVKQLLPWNNTTLLGHAIEQAVKISQKLTVVLGANAEIIQPTITADVEVIINPDWEMGMGTSISFGTHHVLKSKNESNGILILLADQPFLDADYLSELKNEFETGNYKIVGTNYGKRVGVPAIFEASLFSELTGLHQDVGAKKIIERQKEYTKALDAKGRELDIDTINNYNQLFDL